MLTAVTLASCSCRYVRDGCLLFCREHVSEVFLSGMSFEQSFYSRLVAIPVNILIAWPYGMYRDLFMRAARRSLARRAG